MLISLASNSAPASVRNSAYTVCDGKADQKPINEAIDKAADLGGIVELTGGAFDIVDPVIIQSKVALKGVGPSATLLKLAAGRKNNVIETLDFAKLTGTNKRASPAGFEISSLRVDGNRVKNTSGNETKNPAGAGVKIYGKHFLLYNLEITECDTDALYSEWSTRGGVSTIDQQPAAMMNNVRVASNNNNGLVMRGPHDSMFVNFISSGNRTGWQAKFEARSGIYSGGSCELINFHVFGTKSVHKGGILLDAPRTQASNLQSESGNIGLKILRSSQNIFSYWGFRNNTEVQIGDSKKGVSGLLLNARLGVARGDIGINFVNDKGNSRITVNGFTRGTATKGTKNRTTELDWLGQN